MTTLDRQEPAATADDGPPRIRSEREARGWSRRDLAKRFRHAIARRGETPMSLSSMLHNIYRWERMDHTPGEHYRILYSEILGMSQDDLFGIPAEECHAMAEAAGDGEFVLEVPAGCRRVIIEFRGRPAPPPPPKPSDPVIDDILACLL